MILVTKQKIIFKYYKKCFYSGKFISKINKGLLILNILSLIAYFNSICIWYTIWKLYENFALNTSINPSYILFATHYAAAIFLIISNANLSLNGFGKIHENEDMEKEPEKLSKNVTLFRIRYLSVINEN